MAKLRAAGEMAYMDGYRREAVAFIRRDKLSFAMRFFRRVAVWWAGSIRARLSEQPELLLFRLTPPSRYSVSLSLFGGVGLMHRFF